MRIIYSKEFKRIQPIRLNRDGKIIGHLCVWQGQIVYLSRRTNEHFFIRYNGFGLDKILVKKMIAADPAELLRRVKSIIIFYDGVHEKRYFLTTPEDWIDGHPYGTAKDVGSDIETYGEQYVLPIDSMRLIGVHPKDEIAVQHI